MDKVFLPYAHKDSAKAMALAKLLEEHGHEVWIDSYIKPGENWEEAIRRNLEESKVIVALFSSESLQNPNTYFEIGAAIGAGKLVIPVLSEEMDRSMLPNWLRDRHTVVRGLFQPASEKPRSKPLEQLMEQLNPVGG